MLYHWSRPADGRVCCITFGGSTDSHIAVSVKRDQRTLTHAASLKGGSRDSHICCVTEGGAADNQIAVSLTEINRKMSNFIHIWSYTSKSNNSNALRTSHIGLATRNRTRVWTELWINVKTRSPHDKRMDGNAGLYEVIWQSRKQETICIADTEALVTISPWHRQLVCRGINGCIIPYFGILS